MREEEGVGNRAEYKAQQLYARVAVVFSDHDVNFGSPSLEGPPITSLCYIYCQVASFPGSIQLSGEPGNEATSQMLQQHQISLGTKHKPLCKENSRLACL